MAQQEYEAKQEFDKDVRSAQVQSVLSGIPVSVSANTFIALTTAAILYNDETSFFIITWLIVLSTSNFARFIAAFWLKRSSLSVRNPLLVLKLLTSTALFSGLTWATVPWFLGAFDNPGTGAYVVFIIGGISAGALIQSTAYAPNAIAFMAPQLLAVCAKLFAVETGAATFVAFNAVLLTIMMIRSALSSDKQFVKSVSTALEAGRLAKSLSVANRAISDTNRKLELLANHDSLTNLASRACFNGAIADRLERAKRENGKLSLLIFDLDKFKYINDTFGHAAGDTVLAEFARRMLECAQPDELAARLGGDEFAMIISGPDTLDRAKGLAADILAASIVPIDFAGNPLKTGASIGISSFPTDADDVEGLLRCADAALYRAKELGRRRVQVFDASLRDSINRQKTIERGLASAIRFGQIYTEFQPQISLKTNSLSGFETLVRWTHPTLGVVAAEELALAARNTQNTLQLTSFVTRAACSFLSALDKHNHSGLTVAVNISPIELSTEKTAIHILGIVREAGIEPSRIEFEITEESLLDAKATKNGLAKLEESGFKLALDDFGMGHSSLVYLIDNRIDKVKIDRKFVEGLTNSPKNQALVSALVGVSNALSMEILAEGVENKLDAQTLRMLGCEGAQGYYYAQPMKQEAALTWAENWAGRQAAAAS